MPCWLPSSGSNDPSSSRPPASIHCGSECTKQTASYPATNFVLSPGCSLSTPVSTIAILIPLPVTPKSHAATGYSEEFLAFTARVWISPKKTNEPYRSTITTPSNSANSQILLASTSPSNNASTIGNSMWISKPKSSNDFLSKFVTSRE